MRSGNHDAGSGFLGPDGVTHEGNRMKDVKNEYLDSVGGEHVGSDFCKSLAIVAAVERYAHGQFSRTVGLHVIGKALGSHSHSVFVHAVRADSHYSAESASTELKVPVESVFKTCRVALLEMTDLVFGLLVKIAVQPTLDNFSEIFFHT